MLKILTNRILKRRYKLRGVKVLFAYSSCKHSLRNKSYYNVLHVKKNASQADIKAAYYKMCMIYHPDVNKSKASAETFKEITEAYKVLSNRSVRKLYDRELCCLSNEDAADYFKYRYSKSNPYNVNMKNLYRMPNKNQAMNQRYARQAEKRASSIQTSIMNYIYKQKAVMKLYNSNEGQPKPLVDNDYLTVRYVFGITFMLLTAFITTISQGNYERKHLSKKENMNTELFENFPGD